MTIYLGIDIGSTTIKGAVLDLERGCIENIRSQPFPGPEPYLPLSYFEVNPAVIVDATRKVLGELAASTRNIAGVTVCSQMGGLILTDRNCLPRTNYMSWRDQRVLENRSGTNSAFDELKSRTLAIELEAIGNELRPGSASSLLYWLVNSKELPQEKKLIAMGLGDFVIASLCESPPKTEATLALGTLNLQTGQIHREWFDQIGCGTVDWPEVIPTSQPAGTITLNGTQVPCFPAIGDQQAALFGAELADGELSVNVSTGSQVSLLSRSMQPGDYQTRPFLNGQFLNTITHLPAGRSLNALVDLLTELPRVEGFALSDPWSTISDSVEQLKEEKADLEVNLAFFSGSMGACGHIKNIRLENLTVGHLFRAAFENMADNFLHCAKRLSPDQRWKQVVLSGGLPQRIPSLRSAIAKRFTCPIRSFDASEETLTGLLRVARNIQNKVMC